jgi:hypothetical protein
MAAKIYPPRSEAVLILGRVGVSCADIARAMDVSRQSVSFWLAGRYRAPRELIPVVRALAGADVADQVVRAIAEGTPDA